MRQFAKKVPGIVIAGLRGGSGKTLISLGIAGALRNKGIEIAPFKKGPDYIDAGWLSKAAGHPCHNLDTFLCPSEAVAHSYLEHSAGCDLSIVEGNRGLYDGIDTDGSTSTAELAKLLNIPVLLVLDCTKATRTLAAMVLGCQVFDPGLRICGVVLNRIAGKRHELKIRLNIEKFCHMPVIGVLPKLKADDFPERHMGLVTSDEHVSSQKAIQTVADIVKTNLDLDTLLTCIEKNNRADAGIKDYTSPFLNVRNQATSLDPKFEPVTIGIVKDSAFQFYYPDNIEALKKLGARIVYISPLIEKTIPEVDALYMGGGFPETHAPQLSANVEFRSRLKSLSDQGLPIYAECGGLIFLGESLVLEGREYPMSGVFPIQFGLCNQPQGHGYTIVKVVHENPFYSLNEVIKGHEFRYSCICTIDCKDHEMAFRMDRGKGILDKKDGIFKKNTLGTYTHVHALGTPSWAPSLIRKARDYRASRNS